MDFVSKLEEDLAGASGLLVQSMLAGAERHGLLVVTAGVLWDSRDHETTPSKGMLHDLSLRGGAGLGPNLGYGGLNATFRFYTRLYKEFLVFAARGLLDVLVGDPPFYELSRHGGLGAGDTTGGGKSIRGVGGQRFLGKIKLLLNAELRSKFFHFRIKTHRFNVGGVAFVDAGRVWTDGKTRRELDGLNFGLKVGVGGGLRIQWGEHFLVGADFAYSPADGNLGVYIDVDHAF
ncbi:MAG: BamA/TamA family outer membrane protein [bacterium]